MHRLAKFLVFILVCPPFTGCGSSGSNDAGNSSTLAGSSSSSAVDLAPDTEVSKPNILLIIADDLGLDSSAQYSISRDLPNTPTLDALAASGVVFENAWATPACTTTRGSLITGMHGVNSGVDTVPNLMDSNLLTLQRALKSDAATADYSTAVIGKWHIAGTGRDLNHPLDSGVGYYWGNIAGTIADYSNWLLTTDAVQSTSTTYHTTAVTDKAIEWVSDQSSPWFLWLAYVAPHSPYHNPPQDLHDRALSGTADDINANKRAYFLAAIEAMDAEIGRLLEAMTPAERANTLILYIGDNGTPGNVADNSVYSSGKTKGTLYEGGVRVPMLVSGAGVTREAQREEALVNTVDFYPTI